MVIGQRVRIIEEVDGNSQTDQNGDDEDEVGNADELVRKKMGVPSAEAMSRIEDFGK